MELRLQDWQALVGLFVGALGAIAGMYSAFGTTARRLRNDLISDVQLSAQLKGRPRADLNASIGKRAHLLVAATNNPSVTWYEVAMTLLFIPVFWWLWITPQELWALRVKPIEISGPGQIVALLIALAIYSEIVRSWGSRAAERVVYVYERLGDDAARDLVRLLAFPAYIGAIVFVLVFMALALVNMQVIFEVHGWPIWIGILILTALVLGLLWAVNQIAKRERLHDYVRYYTDILFLGSDVPKLRPLELGRTDDDQLRYEAERLRRFRRAEGDPQHRNKH
ncbi:hypothetical protein [Tessaracoccus sp. ZS01]|uniref:hypothetical protein n=1 Tax=Tessaracoccus sp. ZS01 TaxID=1906324 RepID=UPI00096F2D67|nr:hypothetical protein [Tessaracoccus sp. ZS01]MCG6567685.1 hypothetical protein [Tessaracoccus sp. ZS01]OMG55756.1 hypothetical protein BJN44_08640 [Tessaracoccus sp. ZS01]